MHCIQPMFSQSELDYADLYVFVTDMNLERRGFHRKYYNGLPPADLARAAWSVYQDHVLKRIGEQQRRERDEAASGASISSMNSDETEVAECKTGSKSHNRGEIPDPTAATCKNMEEKQIKSVGPGEHIKFVTLVKDLQLRGTPVGSVQWDEQLRIPVFTSTRRDNVTLHGLFFLCPQGRPLDPRRYPIEVPTWRDFEESVLFTTVPLTKHVPERSSSGYVNLLKVNTKQTKFGSSDAGMDNFDLHNDKTVPMEGRIVSHWKFSAHPLRLRVVAPQTPVPDGAVRLAPDGLALRVHRANPHFFAPPEDDIIISQQKSGIVPSTARENGLGASNTHDIEAAGVSSDAYIQHRRSHNFDRNTVDQLSGARSVLLYRPFFFVDDWTVLRRQLMLLSNDMDFPDPPAKLELTMISLGRMRIFKMIEMSMKMISDMNFVSDGDLDEIRRYLSDEYIFRFILMQAIGVAHTILSFMAFKNDVGFWKGRESVAGLSSRTILFNAFASTVIFLYLADYSTSFFLLATSFYSAYNDLWKVTIVCKIRWRRVSSDTQRPEQRQRNNLFERLLGLVGLERGGYSVAERRTAALDSTAMDMLMLAISPLVVGFALYSLIYDKHKSWYSWIVESLANGIYVFGFIFMTPQLFINYKLKSVAHMPWKVMMYKFFSTFIDDVFSFLVAMPTSHRVACFRDDLIFLIFLYQRWCYPVDKKRANEYGYAYDDGDDSNKISLSESSSDNSSSDDHPRNDNVRTAGVERLEKERNLNNHSIDNLQKEHGIRKARLESPEPEGNSTVPNETGLKPFIKRATGVPQYRTVEELRTGLERQDPLLLKVLRDHPDGLASLAKGSAIAAKILEFGDNSLLQSLLEFVQLGVDAEIFEQERQRETTAVLSEAEKAGISPEIIAIEYQKLVRRRAEQRNFSADKKGPSSSRVNKEELQSLEHID